MHWEDNLFFVYSVFKKDIYVHPVFLKIGEEKQENFIKVEFGYRKYFVKFTDNHKLSMDDDYAIIDAAS